MTVEQIKRKIEEYKVSDAPFDVRTKAIAKLEELLESKTIKNKVAYEIQQGLSDNPDFG